MLKNGFISFAFFIFSFAIVAQDYPSLNDLAKQYVKALKREDIAEFRESYTKDSTILANFSKSLGLDIAYALERDFVRILKEGRFKGIDWSSIRFDEVRFSLERDGPFLIAQPTHIYFKHRLFRYSIPVNCTKIKGSWSFVPIARKKEIIQLVPILD